MGRFLVYKTIDVNENPKCRIYSFRKLKKELKKGKTLYIQDGELYISKNRIAIILWNTSNNPDEEDFSEIIYKDSIWKRLKCIFACWDQKKCIGDCYECKYFPQKEKTEMEKEGRDWTDDNS